MIKRLGQRKSSVAHKVRDNDGWRAVVSGAAVDEHGFTRSHARIDGFGARHEDRGEALIFHFVAARHAVVDHAGDTARLPGTADDALNTVLRDDIGVGRG